MNSFEIWLLYSDFSKVKAGMGWKALYANKAGEEALRGLRNVPESDGMD